MYGIDLGTEVVVLNSQVVPISQVVVKTGFTVFKIGLYIDITPDTYTEYWYIYTEHSHS